MGAYRQKVSPFSVNECFRSFRIVARLVFQRIKALHKEALIHFWHKTTLELFNYLTFKRL